MLATMLSDQNYFMYILASKSRKLYIGVTKRLLFRVRQHRDGAFDGFTKKYKVNRLVYFERFQYVQNAITREKEIKGWLRARKVELIERMNPTWDDLYPGMVAGTGEKQILPLRDAQGQDDKVKINGEGQEMGEWEEEE
jgi:putative endonuclease